MFEETRSQLAGRLKNLLDRFETISRRAEEVRSEAELASRMGLTGGETVSAASEILSKSYEQAGLCGASITHLLVDRSFPLMFKRGVGKAEQFASQCETVLDAIDEARRAGTATARQKFGIEN